MKHALTRARLVAALAFPAACLVGTGAARADKPVPPPPPVATVGSAVLPPFPAAAAPKERHPGRLRLRVPFTPVNEDGSHGRRTLLTITVQGEDREQALEAADQVIDRLLVQPAVDGMWDEIDRRIEDAIHSGGVPEVLPMPAPMPATRAVKQQEGAEFPQQPAANNTSPPADGADVEITAEGLVESLDGAAALLGVPSLLGCLGIPVNDWCADPNQRMEELLNQSEDLRKVHEEWRLWWETDQPSHMSFDRVHGGIGP